MPAPHSGPSTGHRPRLALLREGAILFLVATALGFFFGAQIYFSAISIHREVSWGQALYWSFTDWYEWGWLARVELLSPVARTRSASHGTCRTAGPGPVASAADAAQPALPLQRPQRRLFPDAQGRGGGQQNDLASRGTIAADPREERPAGS